MNKSYRIHLLVLLLSFLGVHVNAQSIVSTAGNTVANASYSLTFSVGEPISGDFGTSELSFTSGFASISSLLITSSEEEAQILPEKFDLSQNYPNPFNPSTNIQYSLPKSTAMRIEVFNSIGRLVAILADEQQAAGQHTVRFDATSYSSGIYFYRMVGDGQVIETKKMILIK